LFDQIFGICGASLSATSRAAGGALHLLYTHPEQLDQLIRNPALIPDALEECFRLASNGYFHLPAHRQSRHRGRRHARPQGHSGTAVHPSVPARITASATSSAALPSPSQSAACWRAFLKRI
jgi:hypothetical protein